MNKTTMPVTFALFLLILTIPFQDFILKTSALGQFGTNLSLILINSIFIVIAMLKIKTIKINKFLLLLIVFLFLISSLLLLLAPSDTKETFMPLKVIKNIIFYSQPFVVFYTFFYFFNEYKNTLKISLNLVTYVYILLVIYTMMFYFFNINFDGNNIIHATENTNMRFRLFSEESSMGVTVYVSYGLLTLMNFKNIFVRILITISIIFGLIVFKSKGAFIVLAFILLYLSIKSFKNFIYLISIFLLFSIFFDLLTIIESYLLKNIDSFSQYPSLTTRLGMIFAALSSLLQYPFGTGLGTYIYYFDDYILLAIEYINELFGYLGITPVTYEIESYLDSAKSYSTKSMFFNLVMMFGFIGIYIFYKLNSILWGRVKNSENLLKILFIYLFISHIFFVDSLYLYNFWFSYAVLFAYPSYKKGYK